MEWRAHRERDGPPGAQCLDALRGPLHGRRRPGNHDLTGTVDVRRADHLAFGCLFARAAYCFEIAPQDRRHRPGAHRHCLLHIPPALPDDAHRVAEPQRACRHVGGVFAQAVAGDEVGLNAIRCEHAIGGDADSQDRGLRMFGQRQLLFRTVEYEIRKADRLYVPRVERRTFRSA
jgi:hypothetical protein